MIIAQCRELIYFAPIVCQFPCWDRILRAVMTPSLSSQSRDGERMSELSDDQKHVVQTENNQHLATLQEIKSDTIGGPSGIIIPPYRVMRHAGNDDWVSKTSDEKEYVFCHNDLSQHNIIVDPRSLKI